MIKFLGTILSLFLLSVTAHSQSPDTGKVRTLYVNSQFTSDYKTAYININYLDENKQGELKDELIVYREQVYSISLDEQRKQLILKHSTSLEYREILDLLKQHGISAEMVSYKTE